MQDWGTEMVDPAEVRRAISVLFDHDTVVELRALNVPKAGTVSGYFDGNHRAELGQAACELSGRAPAVYVTLNSVLPDLLARSANRGKQWSKHATSDADIVRRCWFPIDFDPARPSGISATDAEHEAALNRAKECRDWLRELGFPNPVYADSGNGAHLLYRCDLSNDAGITDLFQRCMEAIASKWTDEKVKVDKTVFNPARIWKLYGTLAAKGDSLPDRPHRIARIIDLPDKIEVVSREVLEALAGKAAPAPRPEAVQGDHTFDWMRQSDFNLRKWFTDHKVPFIGEKDWKGDGKLFVINPCPWNAAHTNQSACVILHADGRVTAGCHHDSCSGKGWPDFRDVYEPGWRAKASPAGFRAIEADDDPHLLARKFLEAKYVHTDGLTLRRYDGNWYSWDGAAWCILGPEHIESQLDTFIKAEFDRLSIQAQIKGDEKNKVARPVTTTLLNNVIRALRSRTQIAANITPPAWLDGTGPWPADEIMAARNGLVHLLSVVNAEEKFLHPPTPNFFCTSALDYDFEINALPPQLWLTFLGQVLPNDQESIDTLQEWMGYLLTPDTRQQKILMLIGVPRSGRGTIGRIIKAMLGEKNFAGPTLASFSQNFGLEPLLGKSVAIISDARLSGRNDVALVVERLLSISGEDTLTIDRKFLRPVTCKLDARLMIVSNELPQLKDASGALVSRMLLLRFTESFLGKEDTKLTGKLLPELPGILRWAIDGWSRLRIRGKFVQPQSGKALLGKLENLTSPVRAFIKECCDTGAEHFVPRAVLYKAFAAWAEEEGYTHIPASNMFGRDLESILPQPGDCQRKVNPFDEKKVRVYVGLKLKDEVAARYAKESCFKS